MRDSEFMTDLTIELVGGDEVWMLTSPLRYYSSLVDAEIEAPTGFVTDFASVPRVPVAYTAFGNRAHRESVIHDYLYQTHLASKNASDRIFLEAMKARGKPLWVRSAMYLGVVLGGWSAYKSGPKRYTVLSLKRP